MPSDSSDQSDRMFTCWKEIAAYLGKGVRTVQRWELDKSLPVRRPAGLTAGIVSASRRELDCWLEFQRNATSVAEGIRASQRLHDQHRHLAQELYNEMERFRHLCEALAKHAQHRKQPSNGSGVGEAPFGAGSLAAQAQATEPSVS